MGVLAFILVGCNGRPVAMETSDDSNATTSADSGDTGTDTSADTCEGAALEYHGVCFFPHSVEAMGHDHPLDLDGEPGHELVGVDDGKVSVHKWNGDGFDLVGEADLPGEVASPANTGVVAGEFDDEPGLDLIIAESGEWAALCHLTENDAPGFVAATVIAGGSGLSGPIAVGPDGNGRWRVVAHYDNGEEYVGSQPLGLWEVESGALVSERLELPTEACSFQGCAGADFNGDGRQDAVCTLEDVCPNDPPEQDIVHVVLLAQGDGSVAAMAYPTAIGGRGEPNDLDADGDLDLLGKWGGNRLWYRPGVGSGLGDSALLDLIEPAASSWNLVSIGDLDGDSDIEVIFGAQRTVLVFENVLTAPDEQLLEVNDDNLEFLPRAAKPLDVNGDGVPDLPMAPSALLISEVEP
jgi:hypothetical protein